MPAKTSDITGPLSKPSPSPTGPTRSIPTTDTQKLLTDMEAIYASESQNWYTAKPYGFMMVLRDGTQFVFFLPISPQNIDITTSFATNVIPTLYGTVEEHSDVRYFDIVLEGTTSLAPRYVLPGKVESGGDFSVTEGALRTNGRSSVSISQSSNVSAGGLFSQTLGIYNKLKNKATDLLDGGLQPQAAFTPDNSGFAAFHNFYRFLLRYKKDTSGTDGSIGPRSKHPLTFFNYKDGNMYNVAIHQFVLRRSAENPMLYYYNIQMRGYNLTSMANQALEANDMKQRLIDLGLDGVNGSSILGNIKSYASGTKSVIASAIGGITAIGK